MIQNRINKKKREMHKSNKRAVTYQLWTEIETLQWILEQILTIRRRRLGKKGRYYYYQEYQDGEVKEREEERRQKIEWLNLPVRSSSSNHIGYYVLLGYKLNDFTFCFIIILCWSSNISLHALILFFHFQATEYQKSSL